MRFYNPTPRQYESTYIDQKLPYDYLLKAGHAKQAKYDEGLGKVTGLQKEIKALPIDAQEAMQKQNLLDNKIQEFISSVPNQDYTDPSFQRRFLQAQNEVNKLYRESNKAYEQRIREAEELKKEASEEKDPNFRSYLENQYKELYNPQGDKALAANYDPMSGVYNPVKKSTKFDYRKRPDIDKDLTDITKSINEDKTAFLSNKGISVGDFQSSLAKGSSEFISRSKGVRSLLSKSTDKDMIKSLIIQSNPNLTAGKVEELASMEMQNNKIIDKNGNFVGFNPSTLSGRELQSALDAAVYTKQELDRNILTDPLARQKGAKEETLRSLRGGAGFDEINAISDAPGLSLFDNKGEFDASKFDVNKGSIKSIIEGMQGQMYKEAEEINPKDFYKGGTSDKQFSKKDVEAIADIANWAKDNGIKDIKTNFKEVAKAYYKDVANQTLETSQSYAPNLNAINNLNKTYIDESFRLGNATVYGKGTKLEEEVTPEEAKSIKFQDFVFRNGEPYQRVTVHKEGDPQGKTLTLSITDNTIKQPFKLVAQAEESIRQIKRSGYSDKLSQVTKEEQDYAASQPRLRQALGTDQGYKLVDVLSSPEDRALKYIVAKGRDVKVFGVVNGVITPMSWTDAKVDLGNNILYDRKLIDNPPKEFENILEEQ